MPLPDATAAYQLEQSRVTSATLLLCRRIWARMGSGFSGDLYEMWQQLGPQLLLILVAAQKAAATNAAAYVPTVLTELGIDPGQSAPLSVTSLAGTASDGRPLDSLLVQSILRTRGSIAEGGVVDRGAHGRREHPRSDRRHPGR